MPTRTPMLIVAFAWLACAGCAEQPPSVPRNLVVVSLDTLRADHLGLHGYARATSPNLERFAERAFVFERALAPANYTVASHHALFQSRSAGAALSQRDRAATLAEILKQQGFRTAAFTGGASLSRATGFARGFDTWDESNADLAEALPKALGFLDESARTDGRFYLFVHCFDVHLPYDPPPPYDSLFAPEYRGSLTRTDSKRLLTLRNMFQRKRRASAIHFDAADQEKITALYDGEILRTDSTLAGLFARLDASDLRGDTLVVILSDHGDEFWEHGSVLHAHTLYQELLHVPLLLLRVPRLEREARRIPQRVSLLDVVPTLLELLSVPAPAGLRGRSLVPLLRNEESSQLPVFAESFAHDAKLQAVIDGDHKLIRDLDTGSLALYDLAADPGEHSDLAQSRPQERERLRALLDAALREEATDQDPLALPDNLDPATQDRLRALGYID